MGLKQRATFDERKVRQVAALAAQQVEDVVVNPWRRPAEVLQEIELWAPAIVEGDELSIDDSPSGQTGQCLYDVREPLAEGLLVAREEGDGAILDRDRSISVELDLPHPPRRVRELRHREALHGFDEGGVSCGEGAEFCTTGSGHRDSVMTVRRAAAPSPERVNRCLCQDTGVPDKDLG